MMQNDELFQVELVNNSKETLHK